MILNGDHLFLSVENEDPRLSVEVPQLFRLALKEPTKVEPFSLSTELAR